MNKSERLLQLILEVNRLEYFTQLKKNKEFGKVTGYMTQTVKKFLKQYGYMQIDPFLDQARVFLAKAKKNGMINDDEEKVLMQIFVKIA